jgi:Aldehyde dehydrogenase family
MASRSPTSAPIDAPPAGFVESINPATGGVTARIAATLPSALPDILTQESGKPRVEAIFAELVLALDTADFLARRAPEWLRPERAPHHNLAVKAKAVRMANDSPLGLSASVWAGNARRGREIASRLRTGSVMVNDVASYYGISEAPHGGRGESGWGRSHSRFGLLEMVQVKYVDVDRLPHLGKSWWFGYSAELAASASLLVEGLFAPHWSRRVSALLGRPGGRGVVFRRHRI